MMRSMQQLPLLKKAFSLVAAWLLSAASLLSASLQTHLKAMKKQALSIMIRALSSPFRQIAENAGQEGAIILQQVEKKAESNGYNALTGEYVDMIKAGILDPTKVVRCALENAVSVAAMLLTTEAIVADIPEEKAAPAGR